ncbi:MAG TPA: type II secretion system protein GspD [Firmicutes bacterium]|nr:type II secretion system protein GspD [Bacillota bacterium]
MNKKVFRAPVVLAVVFALTLVLASTGWAKRFEDILISNMFYDTYILDALNDIAIQAEIPIIADSTVTGFITTEFEDLALEDALSRICVPLGFTFRYLEEGYYLVGAIDLKNPSFTLLSDVAIFKTSFVPAKTVADLLSEYYRPYVKVDSTLNTLVVTGSPEMLRRISSDISRIDLPVRQVMLEVLIIELTEDARKALGTEWQWKGTKSKTTATGEVGFVVSALRATSTIAYDYVAGVASFLTALKPMVEAGKAKVRANPRIVAMDGHEADIFLGQEQSFIVETESATGTLTRQRVIIKSGVTLNFLAQIAPTGDITVKLEPEVSQITGFNQDGYPIVSSRRANTTVRVRNQETFVLGGLVNEFESSSVGKVPILGDIPLLGKLFRTERNERSETEVIIMVTPHIIEGDE